MFSWFKKKENIKDNKLDENLSNKLIGYIILNTDIEMKINQRFQASKDMALFKDINSLFYYTCTKIPYDCKILRVQVIFKNLQNKFIPYSDSFDNMRRIEKLDNIILLKELQFDDFKYILQRHNPLVETEDEYNAITDFQKFEQTKFINLIKEFEFTDNFNSMIYNNLKLNNINLLDYLKDIKIYKEQNISKEFLMNLMIQRSKNK